eukprot:TRINITY_DN13351_c0_g1_i1.p1 TRINITY_DN13351_c0_g1~~TRINITY_DN13351_c0_g1_i1.p1  ORF type:complete len:161 (-),score=23.60 TRINITY_DN13351_c0_g1_i1:328-810(-)
MKGEEEKRARFFDELTRNMCWNKADVVAGRHPDRWRKDIAGNIVAKRFWHCEGCLCYEYDHIVPFSKGGESTLQNCQILQSRVNRSKGKKEYLDESDLKQYSCDLKFTEKELDVIEMAVYGNVVRPGLQCRCKSVAEMLGDIKAKDSKMACELPYRESPS